MKLSVGYDKTKELKRHLSSVSIGNGQSINSKTKFNCEFLLDGLDEFEKSLDPKDKSNVSNSDVVGLEGKTGSIGNILYCVFGNIYISLHIR